MARNQPALRTPPEGRFSGLGYWDIAQYLDIYNKTEPGVRTPADLQLFDNIFNRFSLPQTARDINQGAQLRSLSFPDDPTKYARNPVADLLAQVSQPSREYQALNPNEVVSVLSAKLDAAGYTPEAKAAIIGNLSVESAGFTAIDKTWTDWNGKITGGLYQWNGPRFAELQATANRAGYNWKDTVFQIDKVLQHYEETGLKDKLNKANSIKEAQDLIISDLKPAGSMTRNKQTGKWTFTPEKTLHYDRRMANSKTVYTAGPEALVDTKFPNLPLSLEAVPSKRPSDKESKLGMGLESLTASLGKTVPDDLGYLNQQPYEVAGLGFTPPPEKAAKPDAIDKNPSAYAASRALGEIFDSLVGVTPHMANQVGLAAAGTPANKVAAAEQSRESGNLAAMAQALAGLPPSPQDEMSALDSSLAGSERKARGYRDTIGLPNTPIQDVISNVTTALAEGLASMIGDKPGARGTAAADTGVISQQATTAQALSQQVDPFAAALTAALTQNTTRAQEQANPAYEPTRVQTTPYTVDATGRAVPAVDTSPAAGMRGARDMTDTIPIADVIDSITRMDEAAVNAADPQDTSTEDTIAMAIQNLGSTGSTSLANTESLRPGPEPAAGLWGITAMVDAAINGTEAYLPSVETPQPPAPYADLEAETERNRQVGRQLERNRQQEQTTQAEEQGLGKMNKGGWLGLIGGLIAAGPIGALIGGTIGNLIGNKAKRAGTRAQEDTSNQAQQDGGFNPGGMFDPGGIFGATSEAAHNAEGKVGTDSSGRGGWSYL